MNENTDKTAIKLRNLKPFKSGKDWNGNAKGRPKGSGMSLKEYTKIKLANMTPEEKETYLRNIDKEFAWQMAEGRPAGPNEAPGNTLIIENLILIKDGDDGKELQILS